MNSGIYSITTPSGKMYIGSAVNIKRRWRKHVSELHAHTHHNQPLQRAFDKYGISRLTFKKVLICKPDDLLFYEQRAINVLRPEYNICPLAGSRLGSKAEHVAN